MRSKSIISSLALIILVLIFLKPLLWLALILLGVFGIFVISTILKTKDVREQIDKNPQEYFQTSSVNHDTNIIDAEYREREVKEKVENDQTS